MDNMQIFKSVDFIKAGITDVQVLDNTPDGRWLGTRPFILCYPQKYMAFEDSLVSNGVYSITIEKNKFGKNKTLWNKRTYLSTGIDIESILSRFDTLGVPLMRETYLNNPVTVDVPSSSYSRSSIRKCYVLKSSQTLAGIETKDKILVRKTYFDLIHKTWGTNVVMFGKAAHLPVIFGYYDDDVNFHTIGILMPIDTEYRTIEDNLDNFTKTAWEGIQI